MRLLSTIKGRLSNVHIASGEQNIFIFAAPRSGSTYLMEMLQAQPAMKVYNEPLNANFAAVRRELGVSSWEEATLITDRRKAYGALFDKLIRNRVFDLSVPFYKKNGRFLTRRITFKVLHGGEDMVAWFEERFDAAVVILFRHPIATALSHHKFQRLPYLVARADVVESLDREQLARARDIVETGSRLEKGVLGWCLKYRPILQALPRESWTLVAYEDLTVHTTRCHHYLCDRLGLERSIDLDRWRIRPSSSTYKANVAEIARATDVVDRIGLIERWTEQTTTQEREGLWEILDLFAMDLYERDALFPCEPYRLPMVYRAQDRSMSSRKR